MLEESDRLVDRIQARMEREGADADSRRSSMKSWSADGGNAASDGGAKEERRAPSGSKS